VTFRGETFARLALNLDGDARANKRQIVTRARPSTSYLTFSFAMAAMLDQSLDAMIKETRKTQPKRRPMQKKQMGGKKNAQGANARASSAGPAPMSITSGGVRKTTAISKKVARVSANATAMAVDRMPRQNDNRARPSAATPASKTQLIVSNLDWKVTDQDIKVRLSDCSALKV